MGIIKHLVALIAFINHLILLCSHPTTPEEHTGTISSDHKKVVLCNVSFTELDKHPVSSELDKVNTCSYTLTDVPLVSEGSSTFAWQGQVELEDTLGQNFPMQLMMQSF